MEAKLLTFTKVKETKNKAVFEEDPNPNGGPIIGSLYVSKWAVGTDTKLTVRIEGSK